MPPPLLDVRSITKRFPGVVALRDVSFAIGTGEVVAIIGENGAGKSTLMKILGGVHQADEGSIHVDGNPVAIRHVTDSINLGIGFIHQELNILDNIDIGGNVFLGRELLHGGPLRLLDRRRMARESEVFLKRLGLNLPGDYPMAKLSIAQQQLVEIAKALSQKARLLIMDEPTSSLTLTETNNLLATIKSLRSQGVSIIYISHRLGEIEQIADRVVALRDGRNAGELPREQIKHQNMVRMMVGRELNEMFTPSTGKQKSDGCLEVRGLRTQFHPNKRISFTAASGEILGFAGLVGAGRSEMAATIFGVDAPIEGTIHLDGKPLQIRTPRQAIAAGIYLAPEDRRKTGLVTEMTVRENVTLPGLRRHTSAGWIMRRRETACAGEQVRSLRIKTPNVEARVMNLSGGNQQKVVLGKWLTLGPKVLIFDEPTRGIDVGAKAEIYRLMRGLAEAGVIVIMISSDMEEVLGVSDRIAVMHEGAITGILERSQFSEENVMNLAVGRVIETV